jgi:hypothetical protein
LGVDALDNVNEETTDPHDFPMIFFVMLSKQNILASAVPSEAMKVNLYLRTVSVEPQVGHVDVDDCIDGLFGQALHALYHQILSSGILEIVTVHSHPSFGSANGSDSSNSFSSLYCLLGRSGKVVNSFDIGGRCTVICSETILS